MPATHGSAKLRTIQGQAVLTIKTGRGSFRYVLTRLDPDKRVAHPAFQLEGADGQVWHVRADRHGWECDCADAVYRQRPCKHARAVRALWEQGLIESVLRDGPGG